MFRKLRPVRVLMVMIALVMLALCSTAWAQTSPDAPTIIRWTPETYEYYRYYYDLLPAATEDLFDDEIPLLWSESEKQEARDIAARMEAAFDVWIAQYPELKEERPVDSWRLEIMKQNSLEMNLQYAYLKPYEHAGVLRKVFVYLHKDDPALADELLKVLAFPDVPQPKVNQPGDPRSTPEWQAYSENHVGYRIQWDMFSDEQRHLCIEQGRTPDVFTEEERLNARTVLGAIRDGWREWMADHPDIAALQCEGRSAHHAQTQHLAGVPEHFWVWLGVEDEELLADVLAALNLPGAPEPEIENIREEREASKKRLEGIAD